MHDYVEVYERKKKTPICLNPQQYTTFILWRIARLIWIEVDFCLSIYPPDKP